ncbi:response regulator [Planctobacterium marinum]|uniref:hypothetical protein n=1 Tax=Planctobacterium marinum TaxID=1631968 RepID=UPI001E360273|nr:hypothetical protein [Planctobacterium marinum]MCC2605866.1 hypothetical protein [Planctobacterium marinum]
MNQKVTKQLKILIVNQNMAARSELKNMLATLGQSDVTLMKDGRDLVGREQSFKYDLIFIREDLGFSLTGANLVRHLTRSNLVPKWCKFVIITDSAEKIGASPIFRHLRTEILEFPLNYKMVENSVNATIESLQVFQNILKNLNQISPSVLIKSIINIDPSKFDETHKDELLELKIKLLLQGRRPDLAWNISEKIALSSDKVREQLFISFSTGQRERFLSTLDNANGCEILRKGCIYYQTLQKLHENEPELALRCFEKLEESQLQPNEIETHALLLQKVQGLKKALDYLNHKEAIKTDEFDLKNNISLVRLLCYSLASLSGNLDGNSAQKVHNDMVEIIRNNTWSKGSFKYNMYKPFILLGLAALQGKTLLSNFEKLYDLRHQLDVKQLNILLYVAHKYNLEAQAIEVHKMLERNAARLEISPELISFEITHTEVMTRTLTKTEQKARYLLLADLHRQSGRVYRALRKYYKCLQDFSPDDNVKLQILDLMKELGLKQYWSFKSPQALSNKTELASSEETEASEPQIKHSA